MAYITPDLGTLTRIKVIGVGGAGQNAVGSMIDRNIVEGVEFIVMNTDLQVLNVSAAQIRLQLGPDTSKGLGSGSNPEVGHLSAEESLDEIKAHLQGTDMVFIAAGMGGGTGSGASPVIAKVARELGALTVGVVTKPFEFEGARRMEQAERAIAELTNSVDALVVIPNEKLLEVVEEDLPLQDAFKVGDKVIGDAVEGISDLITSTGLVNVDFADVKTIMESAGSALMGIGESNEEDRATKSANMAIKSPLLDVDIQGSTGILINIVGDASMTMHEVNKAAKIISDSAAANANIIFGASIDKQREGMKVTVIATGFEPSSTNLNFTYGDKNESIIEQIDSRHEDSSDDKDAVTDEDEDNTPEVAELDIDTTNFDINKLREQIKDDKDNFDVVLSDDDDDDSNSKDDETSTDNSGKWWKSFSQIKKEK